MLVWSGLGFLLPLVIGVVLILGQLTADELLGEGYYTEHMWLQGLSLVLGGLAAVLVGKLLHRGEGRLLVDPKTGEEVVIDAPRHTFFWIPVHYGGAAVAVLGLGWIVHSLL